MLFLDPEAWNLRRLSARQRRTSSPLPRRIRFRYSNRIALGVDDVERTERAIRGIIGKRLTYRTTRSEAAPKPETA
jgi:hypothetical protein